MQLGSNIMTSRKCPVCKKTKLISHFNIRDKVCTVCRKETIAKAAATNRGKALSIPGDDATNHA
jgi:uncharacterized protein (DUF983 family)